MILEEPRKEPPAGKDWFAVDVTFVHKGTYVIIAKNEEDAKQITEKKCWHYYSEITCTVPRGDVMWCFDAGVTKHVGDTHRATNNELLQKLSDVITRCSNVDMNLRSPLKRPPKGKDWFAVEVSFVFRGTYEFIVENKEQAVQTAKEKCWLLHSEIVSDIPKGKVMWCFGDVEKEIGDVQKVRDKLTPEELQVELAKVEGIRQNAITC